MGKQLISDCEAIEKRSVKDNKEVENREQKQNTVSNSTSSFRRNENSLFIHDKHNQKMDKQLRNID